MSDLAFHALREYVLGDELRHVHWRSSAKANKLQIRQYHDTRRSHLTIVLDDNRDSDGDPDDFETAVSAAASVALAPTATVSTCRCSEASTRSPGAASTSVLDACCRHRARVLRPGRGSQAGAAAGTRDELAGDADGWVRAATGSRRPADGLRPDVHLLLVRS